MSLKFSFSLFLLAALSANAFVVRVPVAAPKSMSSLSTTTTREFIPALHMTTVDNSNNEQAAAAASSDEATEPVAEEQQTEPPAVEEEQPPAEDPELIALKEEIAALETKLKEERRKLAYVSDQAEEFSQAGYARKVAEMENMRRARSMMNSSNRSTATAAILTKFLPIMDQLTDLRTRYGEDDFGKIYNALPGTFMAGFTGLGVTQFTTTVGEPVDKSRVVVLESEHSADHPAGTVLRPVTGGMELQGNVIRMAECVASLGPEPVKEEAAAAAAKEGEEESPVQPEAQSKE